MLLLNSLIRN